MPKPTGGSQFHVTLEREASAKSENVGEDSHRVELEEENYQHVLNPEDQEESYNQPVRFVRNPRLSREARGEPPEYPALEEEEPVRFRQPRQEEEQEPTNPPEEPPEEPQKTPFLDVAVNFILDYWKMISLGLLALLILGLVIFLIVFFVTLKPAGHATVATNSTSSTSTVTGTTLTKPTTITTEPTVTTTTTTIVTQAPTSRTTTVTATTITSSPKTTITTIPAPIPTPDPNAICTDGYTLVTNKCLKLITQPATQTSAYEMCSKTGASLAVIKSGGENRGIGEYLKSQVRKIWIGLQCTENDKSSCQWDFGQGDLTSYSNFVTGSPNVGYGNCVFYLYNESLPDAGQWGNGNCEVDQLSYLCEVPPTIDDYCDFNYNKHCYTRIDYGFTFTDAQDACQRICSNLISIHSELENRFVTSMFNITGYLLLGGVAPSKDLIMWLDDSPRNYNNLKNNFTPDQNCIYMNYTSGDWESVDCASAAWPVCKRKAGESC